MKEKPEPDKNEFYRRVDAGERPYSKQMAREMGLRPGQAYRYMKSRPVPTKVQVTVTPPRPSAAQPVSEQIEQRDREQPMMPALTEDECIDLYKFVWGREGLIADGLLDMPQAGRSDERCKAQGQRLYAIAVKYGWDREQLLGFIGIAVFIVGVGQDSWIMYRAWNEQQKEKKKIEQPKKQPLAAPEAYLAKEQEQLIEKRMGISGPAKI